MTQELEVKFRQADITPFWKKLPFFFLFPFRTSPLVFMVCIAGASALAGITLGAFGLVFKGFLVYLGLRYAFNVLELFAKGRFEGESVDYTLWGPEKRPAKLGLVITLFVVAAINLGNVMLDSRLAKDPRAQEAVIERYRQAHATEIRAARTGDRRIQQARGRGSRSARTRAAAACGLFVRRRRFRVAGHGRRRLEPEPIEPPPDAGPSRE